MLVGVAWARNCLTRSTWLQDNVDLWFLLDTFGGSFPSCNGDKIGNGVRMGKVNVLFLKVFLNLTSAGPLQMKYTQYPLHYTTLYLQHWEQSAGSHGHLRTSVIQYVLFWFYLKA